MQGELTPLIRMSFTGFRLASPSIRPASSKGRLWTGGPEARTRHNRNFNRQQHLHTVENPCWQGSLCRLATAAELRKPQVLLTEAPPYALKRHRRGQDS